MLFARTFVQKKKQETRLEFKFSSSILFFTLITVVTLAIRNIPHAVGEVTRRKRSFKKEKKNGM